MKFFIQITGISILLAAAGFFLHNAFTEVSIHQLKGVQIISTQIGSEFRQRVIFTLAFAFIPLLYAGMKKLLALNTMRQTVFAVSAILITGLIFWQYKIYSLSRRYEELDRIAIDVNYVFARENLHLELYLFLGFILGAVIGSVAFYRFRKRN